MYASVCAASADDVLLTSASADALQSLFPEGQLTAPTSTPLGSRPVLHLATSSLVADPGLRDLYNVDFVALVRPVALVDGGLFFKGFGPAVRWQPYRQHVENWLFFQTFDRAAAERLWDHWDSAVALTHFGTRAQLQFLDDRLYRYGGTQPAAQTTTATAATPGGWYYYRVQADGDTQRAKIWPADSAEPDWQLVQNDIESSPGGFGFRLVSGSSIDVAEVRVTALGITPVAAATASATIAGLSARLTALDADLATEPDLSADPDRFSAFTRARFRVAAARRRLAMLASWPNAEAIADATAAVGEAESITAALAYGTDAYQHVRGIMDRTYRSAMDGSLQPYALYVPPEYDGGKDWPLVVMLHGMAAPSRIQLEHAGLQAPGRSFPYIVLGVNARGYNMNYDGISAADVWESIAAVKARYRIDEDRVYLTGLSTGGAGTAALANEHPDRFAAVAPFSTGPSQSNMINFSALPLYIGVNNLNELDGVRGAWDYFINTLHGTGQLAVYDGWADPEIWTFSNAPVHHHATTVPDYRSRAVFDFFGRFKRVRSPLHFTTQQQTYRHDRIWWMQVTRASEFPYAWTVTADVRAGNRIELTTSLVAQIRLFLDDSLVDMSQPLTVVADGKTVYSGPAQATLDLVLRSTPSGSPWKGQPGTYGNFNLFHEVPVLYVYGSDGSAADTEVLRSEAQVAATREGQLQVSYRVVREDQVTDADLAAYNIVVFGTPDTSALLRRILPSTPLSVDAAGVTLLGRRYAGPGVGIKLIYPSPFDANHMVQLVTGGSIDALRSSGAVGEYLYKVSWMNRWWTSDFIVFDDTVKQWQAQNRAQFVAAGNYSGFEQGIEDRLLDFGTFSIAWNGLLMSKVAGPRWYRDADGDGHGDPTIMMVSSFQPWGYVALGDDCDDSDPAVHPGAVEIEDGKDNDCNGLVDDLGVVLDADHDGIPGSGDNCPFIPNPGQQDRDGNGIGDACDENDGLILFKAITRWTLTWQLEPRYTRFAVHRGSLANLRMTGNVTQAPADVPLAALFCDIETPSLDDPTLPPPGQGVFWLVSGTDGTTDSGLGDGTGTVRMDTYPCPTH